jgi:hypothetical protein
MPKFQKWCEVKPWQLRQDRAKMGATIRGVRMRKLVCVLAMAGCVAFAAPSFAQIPPGPLPTPNTAPPENPRPNTVLRQTQPGRPAQQQTTLPINGFGANQLRCAQNLASATMQISAWLAVRPNTARAPTIDVELDGRLLGVETVRPQNGLVIFSRRVDLSGATGTHRLKFILDGAVQSEVRTFTHECVRLTQMSPGAAPVAVLPNLAFGSLMYAQVMPRTFEWTASGGGLGESQLVYRRRGLSAVARSYTDIANLSGVIPLTSAQLTAFCTGRTGSEQQWAEIAVEIRPNRIGNPDQLLGGMSGTVAVAPGQWFVRYIDTRGGARFLNAEPANDDASEGPPLPAGHEWLVVGFPLQCTRSQQMEFRFDPNGSVTESSESDNVLRFRYSTQ